MKAGPGDGKAGAAAAGGHLRASDADREQMIETLKSAFTRGALTKGEFDARIGRTLASATYAELAEVAPDIPAGRAGAQPPGNPPRRQVSNGVRWGVSGFVTPAIIAVAFGFASLRGGDGCGIGALIIAGVYFLFWLSVGSDMLWEWYSMSLPTARMCVRCAHTAASHRAPASCAVRLSSLNLLSRCPCAGYVPPGMSPQKADLRLLSTGSLQ